MVNDGTGEIVRFEFEGVRLLIKGSIAFIKWVAEDLIKACKFANRKHLDKMFGEVSLKTLNKISNGDNAYLHVTKDAFIKNIAVTLDKNFTDSEGVKHKKGDKITISPIEKFCMDRNIAVCVLPDDDPFDDLNYVAVDKKDLVQFSQFAERYNESTIESLTQQLDENNAKLKELNNYSDNSINIDDFDKAKSHLNAGIDNIEKRLKALKDSNNKISDEIKDLSDPKNTRENVEGFDNPEGKRIDKALNNDEIRKNKDGVIVDGEGCIISSLKREDFIKGKDTSFSIDYLLSDKFFNVLKDKNEPIFLTQKDSSGMWCPAVVKISFEKNKDGINTGLLEVIGGASDKWKDKVIREFDNDSTEVDFKNSIKQAVQDCSMDLNSCLAVCQHNPLIDTPEIRDYVAEKNAIVKHANYIQNAEKLLENDHGISIGNLHNFSDFINDIESNIYTGKDFFMKVSNKDGEDLTVKISPSGDFYAPYSVALDRGNGFEPYRVNEGDASIYQDIETFADEFKKNESILESANITLAYKESALANPMKVSEDFPTVKPEEDFSIQNDLKEKLETHHLHGVKRCFSPDFLKINEDGTRSEGFFFENDGKEYFACFKEPHKFVADNMSEDSLFNVNYKDGDMIDIFSLQNAEMFKKDHAEPVLSVNVKDAIKGFPDISSEGRKAINDDLHKSVSEVVSQAHLK